LSNLPIWNMRVEINVKYTFMYCPSIGMSGVLQLFDRNWRKDQNLWFWNISQVFQSVRTYSGKTQQPIKMYRTRMTSANEMGRLNSPSSLMYFAKSKSSPFSSFPAASSDSLSFVDFLKQQPQDMTLKNPLNPDLMACYGERELLKKQLQ